MGWRGGGYYEPELSISLVPPGKGSAMQVRSGMNETLAEICMRLNKTGDINPPATTFRVGCDRRKVFAAD